MEDFESSPASQSILIPALPESPDILGPGSPASSQDVLHGFAAYHREDPPHFPFVPSPEPESLMHQPTQREHSATYTQAGPANDNAQDILIVARDGNSNNSEVILNRDNRRTTIVGLWSGPAQLNDNSHSAQAPSSSRSSLSPSANEDSNSLISLPEAQVRMNNVDNEEPPLKMRKLSSKSNDDLDGETCPICLDSWGNSGEHRLVALKCGHLFGAQCVERWLRAQTAKERSCPTCKSKSTLKDIRHIYARRLVAVDTSQITTLQKQLDLVQSEKSRAELELQKSRIAQRACMMQLEILRSTLMKSQGTKEQTIRKSWRFALEKNLEITKDGGCRVLTYNCRTYELYVTQKTVNYLFPGYGIRKVSCVDYKLGQFVHLHQRPIRDITYSQPRDLLLSAGLDSTARIMERGILSVTVNTGVPLWSCSWDYLRSNEFFVGGVGGVILQYDVRNPSTFIQRLQSPSDLSPVVSVCSTEYGLLSCQLNSSWLWVANMRQWEPRELPVEGTFMSLSYDNESHRVAVSCRPGPNGERSKVALFKLKASVPSGDVMIETENTFSGSARSSVMTRAGWVRAPSSSWVAVHSESDSSLCLNGLDGVRSMCLPAAEPALDVCSMQLNGDTLLAALSDTRLRLYKAVPTNS